MTTGRIRFFVSKLTFTSSALFSSAQDYLHSCCYQNPHCFQDLRLGLVAFDWSIYMFFFHQFKFQDVSDVNHGMRPFRIDCWLLTWERKGASHAEGKDDVGIVVTFKIMALQEILVCRFDMVYRLLVIYPWKENAYQYERVFCVVNSWMSTHKTYR